jgi:hypothetical protein
MNLLEIGLIALLATYRITFMLNSESGPGDIFTRLRTRLGVTYDEYSRPVTSNWIAEGVLCYFCLSVWMAFVVTGLLVLAAMMGHIEAGALVLLPFALSGGAVYLKKMAG